MKSALLILACSTLCAGDGLPRYYTVQAGDPSPQRDILVEYYRSNGPGMTVPEQIWLVSTSDPAKRHLLFTHDRAATVLFSSDEKWLVINNHCLSDESRLLLYRRKADLEYEQVADLTDAAWKFFNRQNGRSNPAEFDHSYVEALRWASDDPPTLLLSLDGHMDSRNHTSDWYCFYDVQAKAFSVDLAAHNKKTTKLEPE